ncbi:MAG: hypothetical protein KKF27_20870, partial [Gammaproteobacteria bacterium]|nr:hypothetical protein [Gammaproteobacteria bacterium]
AVYTNLSIEVGGQSVGVTWDINHDTYPGFAPYHIYKDSILMDSDKYLWVGTSLDGGIGFETNGDDHTKIYSSNSLTTPAPLLFYSGTNYLIGPNSLDDYVNATYWFWSNNITCDEEHLVIKVASDEPWESIMKLGKGNLTIESVGGTVTVDEILKIEPRLTAPTCGPGTNGAIYYNNATHIHYGCNSTSWRALYTTT